VRERFLQFQSSPAIQIILPHFREAAR
jgi:hypothetical protein